MFFHKQTTWYRVYPTVEEPKKYIPLNRAETVRVGNRNVCIVNSPKGLFAISDRCPHNGFPLVKGWCTKDGDGIVCPLHRYAFSFENGRAIAGSGNMTVYPLEEREDGVYVGIEETVFRLF